MTEETTTPNLPDPPFWVPVVYSEEDGLQTTFLNMPSEGGQVLRCGYASSAVGPDEEWAAHVEGVFKQLDGIDIEWAEVPLSTFAFGVFHALPNTVSVLWVDDMALPLNQEGVDYLRTQDPSWEELSVVQRRSRILVHLMEMGDVPADIREQTQNTFRRLDEAGGPEALYGGGELRLSDNIPEGEFVVKVQVPLDPDGAGSWVVSQDPDAPMLVVNEDHSVELMLSDAEMHMNVNTALEGDSKGFFSAEFKDGELSINFADRLPDRDW